MRKTGFALGVTGAVLLILALAAVNALIGGGETAPQVLSQVNTPAAAPLVIACFVNEAMVGVRSGPGAVFPQLTRLSKNTEVRAVSFVAQGIPSGAWVQIERTAGRPIGYIPADGNAVQCREALNLLPVGRIPPTPVVRAALTASPTVAAAVTGSPTAAAPTMTSAPAATRTAAATATRTATVAATRSATMQPTRTPTATPTATAAPARTATPAGPRVALVPVEEGDVVANPVVRGPRSFNNGQYIVIPWVSQEQVDAAIESDGILRFNGALGFGIEILDRTAGRILGAGIKEVLVEVSYVDEDTGREVVVHQQTERIAPYCVFGDREGQCTVWRFDQNGDQWPGGALLVPNTEYTVAFNIVPKKGNPITWRWHFEVSTSVTRGDSRPTS